ncbi:voltage-dependent calcium channel gamma-3 subunit-like [Pollicipes pollicipes]|uniref:voltage-dependent calcium channel gamma-3 subunit-like n=1 Tax=Pollicipes pollicipes TaxID=41117 RepID=UPI001884DA26|nr:voltage-dependent calcium channel gamma-3 subunit-like [Pollicipes pollicipes]
MADNTKLKIGVTAAYDCRLPPRLCAGFACRACCSPAGASRLPAGGSCLLGSGCSPAGVSRLLTGGSRLLGPGCSPAGVSRLLTGGSRLLGPGCSPAGVSRLPAGGPCLLGPGCSPAGVSRLPAGGSCLLGPGCSPAGVSHLPAGGSRLLGPGHDMAGTLNVTVRWLRWIAPGTALISLTLVAVAMATPAWLSTTERFPNGTEVLEKETYSGLWFICFTPLGSRQFECHPIDYFPREYYSPDATDSTMAIPNAVITTGPFLFAGAAVLLTAEICYAVGHLFRRRRLLSFVGGVNFILAGLLAMIATIVYISTFKAEVKSKLRARTLWDPPRFTYRFGYSFFVLVAGFIMAELTGIIVVFLYIFWHQRDWERKGQKLAQQQTLTFQQVTPI